MKKAVLLVTFNRLDTTQKVFEQIRIAQPPRLYLASDGAREGKEGEKEKVEEVRNWLLSNINWECEVKTRFLNKNSGGCANGVSGAVTWFFKNEEDGIILEDDCVPNQSFFMFCEELLDKYENDNRIWHIAGISPYEIDRKIKESYYFSKVQHCWGWATWADRWKYFTLDLSNYDEKNVKNFSKSKEVQKYWLNILIALKQCKIDSWAYPWAFIIVANKGYCINPIRNLVSNIGITGVHYKNNISDKNLNRSTHKLLKLIHPKKIKYNDKIIEEEYIKHFYIKKEIFYKHWYEKIISIKNNHESHKILTIMGIKFKFKYNIYQVAYKQLKKYKEQGFNTLYIPVSGIGDGILFTPIAKAVYKKTGKKILVSHKNNELYKNNPYIKTIDDLHDTKIDKNIEKKIKEIGFNIIYPTYWHFKLQDNRYSLVYPKQHIIAETASKAGIEDNIEIKPEIFLTEEEKNFGRIVPVDKKQIVIMSTALDKHKQYDYWQNVVNSLSDKYYFIQLGSKNDIKLKNIDDRRNKYTLRECACILYNSDLFVGQIGGLMHMARAVNCPSVIAYSSAEPYYFDSYICNINVLPQDPCYDCIQNGTSAYSTHCTHGYSCINSIKYMDIIEAIEQILTYPRKNILEYETYSVVANIKGMEEYYKRYSEKLIFMP